MTAGLMRTVSPATITRAHVLKFRVSSAILWAALRPSRRNLAIVREPDRASSDLWFTSSIPRPLPAESGCENGKPPDERTLKLGKTIRILHERLPNLLASPLPQEILSPQIKLLLFPSTHPHLPTVSGRIAYTAALWTAPVAWGRVPVLGNVKLEILSERLIRNGGTSTRSGFRNEKLVVRWKTCGKAKSNMGIVHSNRITDLLGGKDEHEEFCGLFIFEFDEEGRIVTHTIEHAQEGGNWDRPARVISVTDWLLGRAWRKRSEEIPSLALGYCEANEDQRRIRAKKPREP